jgi:hydroxyacylglutathione hydrolase
VKLEVRKLPLGMLEANCYLVWDADSPAGGDGRRPCLVIDPGAEPETILAVLREERLRPSAILATHCHGDHIGAADELLAEFPDADWMVGEPERDWPGKPSMNLSYGFGLSLKVRLPKRLLKDGDEISISCQSPVASCQSGAVTGGEAQGKPADNRQLATDNLSFKALSVPGHSPGSIAYYCEGGKAVFTGDALFAGDIGRADLPGGNERQLVESVRSKILTLPEDTVIWPGHANRSRVGSEKRNNPYVGDGAG